MTSILTGTAKIAGWTLAAAVLAASFVSSSDEGRLAGLSRFFAFDPPAAPVASPLLRPTFASPPVQAEAPIGPEVVLDVGAGGNFHTTAEINGSDVPMVVDTGASMVVLSAEQAERLGLHPMPSDYRLLSQTANGVIRLAKITLGYIRVGSVEVHDVEAAIAPRGAVGREGLLGMTFLQRLQSYQVASGRLILRN
jgi:aspartyl protease family protein